MAKKAAITDFEVETSSFVNPAQFLAGLEEDAPEGDADEDDEPEQESEEDTAETGLEEAGTEDEDNEDEGEEGDDEFSYTPFVADLEKDGILTIADGKEYDDTPEGFAEVIKDTVEAKVQSTIAALPPTAKRLMELALKGAKEDDLQALLTLSDGPDWEEADLEEEDVQRAIVEEAMRLRDPELSDEDVAEAIQDLVDIGKLDKTAAKDQKFLIKAQEAEKAKVEAAVESRNKEAQEAYDNDVAYIRNYITEAKEIGGLPVTKKDREDFMAYLTVKGKDGLTEADRRNTAERQIQKEYLAFKDFNLDKLKRAAVTDATKEVKKQLGRYNAGKRPANTGSRPATEDGFAGKIMSPAQFLSAQDN